MNKQYWAKAVKDRDGWKCRVCGSIEKLNAHHLLSVRENPNLALDVNNGITLCRKCHRIAHHGRYEGSKINGILSNPEWFTDKAVAAVDGVINRAINETMKRDKEG